MRYKVYIDTLTIMWELGGTWAVYQNQDMGSPDLGGCRFLQVGEDCTFGKPPERFPDTNHLGAGWRYGYIDILSAERIVCHLAEATAIKAECGEDHLIVSNNPWTSPAVLPVIGEQLGFYARFIVGGFTTIYSIPNGMDPVAWAKDAMPHFHPGLEWEYEPYIEVMHDR